MKNMTLMQHFSELRRRILWVLLVFVLAFLVGLWIAPGLQNVLTRPLLSVWSNGAFIYSGLSDGLMIQFSLAAMFGLLVVVPCVLWHLWAFVAPGLKEKERRFIWPVLFLSPVLFALGAGFAFYVLFPVVFKFFVGLNLASPVPAVILPDVRDYLSFAIGLLKVFGVVFQLPLVLVMLNRAGILSRSHVAAFRRYAIIFIVIVAAVLTPPDIVSQILLALPMWALFEISILFMRRD